MFKSPDNLPIIPYQLTKFQAPSSNSFLDTLLTILKCPKLQKLITLERFDKIGSEKLIW